MPGWRKTIYFKRRKRAPSDLRSLLTYMNDHWEAKYPWIRDSKELPNNRIVTFGMLKSTERRLWRNSKHVEIYSSQIQDRVKTGVAGKLTQEEIDSYKGPVLYLSHHETLKPDSELTLCRIVFNWSASFKGDVLNSYWEKWPNLFSNLLEILIRIRENNLVMINWHKENVSCS